MVMEKLCNGLQQCSMFGIMCQRCSVVHNSHYGLCFYEGLCVCCHIQILIQHETRPVKIKLILEKEVHMYWVWVENESKLCKLRCFSPRQM